MNLISYGIMMLWLPIITCEWQNKLSLLTSNKLFSQSSQNDLDKQFNYFNLPTSPTTQANFITCSSPSTSYITLTNLNTQAQYYISTNYSEGLYIIQYDLFFQGTWNGEGLQYKYGSLSNTFYYTSTTYTLNTGFCDSLSFDVKSVQFTITLSAYIYDYHIFTKTGTNDGYVSIRNFLISKLICYPSCSECTGPNNDQCTQCYYGNVVNGICPSCPTDKPFYMKYEGCKTVCNLYYSKFTDGFCQSFPYYTYYQSYISTNVNSREKYYYSILYDPDHVDTSIQIQYFNNQYIYGIFKYRNGLMRTINLNIDFAYPILIVINLILYNQFSIDNGIVFLINNTKYGGIQMKDQGLELDRVKLYSDISYSSTFEYTIYLLADIPKYDFTFSIIGNLTNPNIGWGLRQLIVTSGYCPLYCQLCEVSFKCKECQSGYYFYRDGTCIWRCYEPFQKIISNYCYDYDDETKYSKYLIQEFINLNVEPDQYLNFELVSQSGTNFLKGITDYFSVFNNIRIFGGQFVWAQAKFKRVFQIPDPHHSITIGFYIIFGPNFPTDGSFIYTIENNTPVSKQKTLYREGQTITLKIYEKISHNTQTLTIQWECYGLNNEPVYSFCGFYHFYIAVHYCQPYCLQCTDQFTCQQFNSTFNSNIIKFSQSECQLNEYFQQDIYQCKSCPQSCLTCLSNVDCLTCKSSYTLYKLGCFCKQNQYESNDQCQDCPIECNQCLSPNNCIECLNSNYRKLLNGKCVCINGYYEVINDPICKQCNYFCKTCNGPTQNDCLTCSNIANIQQTGNTCQCQSNTYYDEKQFTCLSCSTKCETCFFKSQYSCLSCSGLLNRVLDGLECKCKVGYFEDSNQLCIQCPTTEDSTLMDCYKICVGQTQIWHTLTCSSCDSGFQLIEGECQPICGDSVIKGYEQCDDGNNIMNDGCYHCQFQCQQNCLTCDNNTIIPCSDICGDGYITGLEECEDGNDIQYDGCYQCKFQCQQPCTNCVKGKCFECATKGWQLNPTVSPWICKEMCGDGLIVGIEQCDDENLYITDGCKDCKFFCREGCLECDFQTNKCLKCPEGFIPQSYYCKNVCGDGLIVSDPTGINDEVCDDGYTSSYYGCRNCKYYSHTESCNSYQSFTKTFPETQYNLQLCSNCNVGYRMKNGQKYCQPICKDGLRVNLEACDDSLSQPYKCQNCQPFCQSSCKTCRKGYLQYLFPKEEGCYQCKNGYKLIDGLCYSICGDQFITEDEDCDDGNLLAQDGCHFCKFDCQESCEVCYKNQCLYCKDGYEIFDYQCYLVVFLSDGKQSENIINHIQECPFHSCNICYQKQCLNCKTGYIMFDFECIPNLNDGILVQYNLNKFEQCDDGNTFQFDGCYESQFSCEQNCQRCNFGNCIECQLNYELKDEKCLPVCGDGIIAPYSIEYCDDENQDQNDGCFNCKNECTQGCVKCFNLQCMQCLKGYRLNGKLCEPICGDKYIIPEVEECEVGINSNESYCINCVFFCGEGCSDCQQGLCLQCYNGYKLEQNICTAICGDQILVGQEECDDGNMIPYDGCYQCRFQCPQYCKQCYQGVCSECDQYYILNQQICEQKPEEPSQNTKNLLEGGSICGNGYINEGEDCDDQNNYPLDGCFNCEIEDNWICQKNRNCFYSENPKIKLTYLNQKFQTQFVQFEFSQNIQIQGNLSLLDILEFQLEEFAPENYKLNYLDLFENKFIIKIDTLVEINIKPKLIVSIFGNVTNQYNQTLESNISSIYLQIPQFMSTKIKEEAQQLKKQNYTMIIVVIVLASLSLILGDFDIVFESCSILQFQSFLRYINLAYPENVLIYFESSDSLTIQPILSYLKFDKFVDFITFKGSITESTGKFKEYEQDADLFTSLQTQFIQASFVLLLLLAKKLINYLNNKIIGSKNHEDILLWAFSNIGVKFANKLKKLFLYFPKLIFFIERQLNINQITSILLLNAWDILLKSFLFIESIKNLSSIRSIASYILSLVIIGIYIYTILNSLFQIASRNLKSKINFYQGLELLRILSFQYILVFFQKTQVLQILLITIVNITQICILISQRRILKITDFISKISVDLSVAVATISSIFYIDNFCYFLSNQQKAYIGQAQIYMLVIGLGVVTLKLSLTKIISIVNYLKKNQCFSSKISDNKTSEGPKQVEV